MVLLLLRRRAPGPYRIHYHELTLRGSYHHTPAAIREALALLAGGYYPFAELLTHAYPLERVAEPLAQAAGLAEPDDRLLKAVDPPVTTRGGGRPWPP